ncbi:hypothetical protein ID866_8969 [Astraeus odoratus]|nr:hypothetical protein ID866_8969 [Astraeus odoratus]
MRAIQGVLGIDMTADMLMDMGMSQLGFNGLTSTSQTTSIGSPGLVGSSWVDLLLWAPIDTEHYKATCRSPNSSHPPVNLRLSSPQEAGFLLQRVPVRTASQVSRILEVSYPLLCPA